MYTLLIVICTILVVTSAEKEQTIDGKTKDEGTPKSQDIGPPAVPRAFH